MGTRGAYGFYKNKVTKITYNHFDSYPEGLGISLLDEIRKLLHLDGYRDGIEHLNDVFKNIVLVQEDTVAPPDLVEKYKDFADTRVSTQEMTDWYVLLRDIQGTLQPYFTGEVKHMIDSRHFIKDSLFCEWAYIINLTTERYEVWEGFQNKPTHNRYAIDGPDEQGYFACKLLTSFPLKKLPSDRAFIKKCDSLVER